MLYQPPNATFERCYCLPRPAGTKYKHISEYLPFFLFLCLAVSPCFSLLAAVTPYLLLYYSIFSVCPCVLLISSFPQSALFIYLE